MGMKISVCGKGGSGKSTLVTLLAHAAQARELATLVVDSDESNTGLERMLGSAGRSRPLIELLGGKQKLEEEIVARVKAGETEETMQLVKEEMPVASIPAEYVIQKDGIKLVIVGKILMALEGCACPMGIVSRSFLKQLRLEADEVALIDLEAGVEHFGRGVETSVDCVLVVVEPSIDSLEVAEKISELANQIDVGDVWAVLNKIASDDIAARLTEHLNGKDISVIGSIPQDPDIFQSCLEGRPIQEGVAAQATDKILDFLFP